MHQGPPSSLLRLRELAESGTQRQLHALLRELRPADLARVLESSPVEQRIVLWNLFEETLQSAVLSDMGEELVADLFAGKSAEEIAQLLENVGSDDDMTDILQQLPATLTAEVLAAMDAQNRARVENLLSYPEDTAGGLMATDTVAIRPNVTLDVIFRYLRRHDQLPPTTDSIFVVTNKDEFMGILPLTTLLVSDPSLSVRQVMVTATETIPASLPRHDVAARFEKYNLVSAPVLDDNNRLLGRITIDDVVDVIRDEADQSLLSMAGLDAEDDLFAPIVRTAKSRAFWLGANLLTAFIAAAVIDVFKETIAQVVALAVLMPIVASMGGVAGSQTLTLVIRNMAQDELFASNLSWLVRREVAVGLLNGLLWALVVAISASLVFQDDLLGVIIAAALVTNLLVAALAGALLPSLLKSIGIDPAIAGTVVLTTITDVVGFMSFLGLATLFYA